jgi:hypothetical protein
MGKNISTYEQIKKHHLNQIDYFFQLKRQNCCKSLNKKLCRKNYKQSFDRCDSYKINYSLMNPTTGNDTSKDQENNNTKKTNLNPLVGKQVMKKEKMDLDGGKL